jgi:hypothetical protein
MKRLLALCTALLLPLTAQATTFTVNADSVLTRANAQAVGGDLVNLAPMTFTVAIEPVNSGTAGNYITYKGSSLAAPTATVVPGILIKGKSYLSIKGVTTTATLHDATADSVEYGSSGALGTPSTHDSLAYCFFRGGFRMSGGHFHYVGHNTVGQGVGDQRFELSYVPTVPPGDSTRFCTFEDNVFYVTAMSGRYGTYMRAIRNCSFARNVYNVWSQPNHADGGLVPRYFIVGNTFTDEKYILRNDNNQYPESFGFILRDRSRFNTFVRDTFMIHPASAYQIKFEFSSAGNDSTNYHLALGDGLGGQAYNTWAECYFKGDGIIGMTQRSHGYTFTGCTFVLKSPIGFFADSMVFRHNTVINTTGKWALTNDDLSQVTNSTLRKNILVGSGYTGQGVVGWPAASSCPSDSNLIYSYVVGPDNALYDGSTVCTVGPWANCTKDRHSRWFNPDFRDPSFTNTDLVPLAANVFADSMWGTGDYVGALAEEAAPDTTFTLTISNSTGGPPLHGTVVRTPSQTTYAYRAIVGIKATPDAGYIFSGFTGDTTATADSITVAMTRNRALVATFTAGAYTLTVNHQHGTVSKTPDLATYAYGQAVRLTPSDSTGWHFTGWSGDTTVADRLVDTLTVIMRGNKTITGTWEANTYAVATTIVGSGTVTRFPSQASYAHGSTVFLTAGAAPNFAFMGWTGDTTTTANPLFVTMLSNLNVIATFAVPDSFVMTVNTSGTGTVTATPEATPAGKYADQTMVSLSALPGTGRYFYRWEWTNNRGTEYQYANPGTFYVQDSASTVTGVFLAEEDSVILAYHGVNCTVTDSLQTLRFGESGNVVVAVPSAHHHLLSWSDGRTGYTRQDFNVTSDTSFTATAAIDTFTLIYTAGAHGSITGTLTQTLIYGASADTVIAVPDAGYKFVRWSDGVTTAMRRDTGVSLSKTLAASFTFRAWVPGDMWPPAGGRKSPWWY